MRRLLPSLPLLAGCWYGFAGGGLPADIKTVAVLPFDNLTTEPALTQEVNVAVNTAMQGRLGLRSSGESTADAVVLHSKDLCIGCGFCAGACPCGIWRLAENEPLE
mgnify:CR=1 FL=1